jgi:hypothetical protein
MLTLMMLGWSRKQPLEALQCSIEITVLSVVGCVEPLHLSRLKRREVPLLEFAWQVANNMPACKQEAHNHSFFLVESPLETRYVGVALFAPISMLSFRPRGEILSTDIWISHKIYRFARNDRNDDVKVTAALGSKMAGTMRWNEDLCGRVLSPLAALSPSGI